MGSRRLLVGVATAAVALFSVVAVRPAGAVSRSGAAEIVDHADSTHRIEAGGSSTTFSLHLPSGASCPGDSTDGNYRVESFIVPTSYDPGALKYYGSEPIGDGTHPLYQISSNPYEGEKTARATNRGGPGPIVNIPPFNFAVFPPGMLKPGHYYVGLACTLFNVTKRYWSTTIEITSASADQPAQLHWRALAYKPNKSGSPVGTLATAALVIAAAVIGVRYLARRPRVRA